MLTGLISLFERDLEKLKFEIQTYTAEEDLWKTSEGITNAAGSLALHICGNLKHFIGAILGDSAYVRDRPAEFASKVSRENIISEIDETLQILKKTLSEINQQTLEADYPEEVLGYKMKTDYFLIHLHGHLTYHLGQINYHRRIICYK